VDLFGNISEEKELSYEPVGLSEVIFKERYAAHKEETWPEACERVATSIARPEQNGKFLVWKERFFNALVDGKFCPGGRIWYGAGRPKQQMLNCFVLDAQDSREGWGKVVSDMIVVSGLGGGVGINGSSIRPRGTPIRGTGGIATGAVSLFDVIDSAGEVIKAGGGRRTALMLCLDIAHPDVVEFVDKKFTKIKRYGDAKEIESFIKKEFEPILSADKWTIYFPKKNKFLKLIEYEIDPAKLKVKITSPFAKFVRYNIGDSLLIIANHNLRHLKQAGRVMKSEKFPAS